jgi:hypothetical protein
MKVSWDDSSLLNGNIKVMFQTSNQNINQLVGGYQRVCHGHIMAIPVAYRGENISWEHIMGYSMNISATIWEYNQQSME